MYSIHYTVYTVHSVGYLKGNYSIEIKVGDTDNEVEFDMDKCWDLAGDNLDDIDGDNVDDIDGDNVDDIDGDKGGYVDGVKEVYIDGNKSSTIS